MRSLAFAVIVLTVLGRDDVGLDAEFESKLHRAFSGPAHAALWLLPRASKRLERVLCAVIARRREPLEEALLDEIGRRPRETSPASER